MDFLGPGDTLVVVRLDRLGRSRRHFIETAESLQQRGGGPGAWLGAWAGLRGVCIERGGACGCREVLSRETYSPLTDTDRGWPDDELWPDD